VDLTDAAATHDALARLAAEAAGDDPGALRRRDPGGAAGARDQADLAALTNLHLERPFRWCRRISPP